MSNYFTIFIVKYKYYSCVSKIIFFSKLKLMKCNIKSLIFYIQDIDIIIYLDRIEKSLSIYDKIQYIFAPDGTGNLDGRNLNVGSYFKMTKAK